MNTRAKLQEFFLISGLILAFVVGVVIISSQRDLSVAPNSEAAGLVTPLPTDEVATLPTPSPTPAITGKQDVPLQVLGSKQEQITGTSYLYTELTSKGIINNVSDNSVAILWLTEAPQATALQYGTKQDQLVRRVSSSTMEFIHQATLSNLARNVTYYFTGPAPIVDSFITPGFLPTAPTIPALTGFLKDEEGQCLVRGVFMRDSLSSAYATSLTTTQHWTLPLTGLRTADFSAYYIPKATDSIELDVLCIAPQKVVYSGSIKLPYSTVQKNIQTLVLHREN